MSSGNMERVDEGHSPQPKADKPLLPPSHQPSSSTSSSSNSSLIMLDQISAAAADFLLIHHPLSILRLQCQANSHAEAHHINPISALHILMTQLGQHGVIRSLTKGLQSNCMYITIDGIVKKILIEGISELSGIDLNLSYSAPTTVKDIKHSIGGYILRFITSGIKTVLCSTVYSSDLLIKCNSLHNYERGCDELLIRDFLRTAWSRFALDIDRGGFSFDAMPFSSIIAPTLMSLGGERLLTHLMRPMVRYVIKLILYGDLDENKHPLGQRELFYLERYSDIFTWFITKMTMYKFEVVSTKMHIQGTRAIIDNTDTGIGVVQVQTRFTGFWNCWWNTSMMGQNYNGFGFVVLDAALRLGLAFSLSKIGN